jgi:hypothetical protein
MDMNSTMFSDLVEPILNKIFDGTYDAMQPEWSKIFDVEEGQKARFQETTLLYGFGLAVEKPEGTGIATDQGGISYRVRMIFRTFGLAFGLTEEMVEDSSTLNLGATFSKHLAKSMFETKEFVHADVFNRSGSNTFLLGDGQPLLSASHPLAVGGTWSNQLASPADISEAALEALITQIKTARDDRGLNIPLKAEDIIVSPGLWFDTLRILRSTLQSGTANNDPNVLRDTNTLPREPITLTRCTQTSGYWIKTNSPNGLKHYRRRAIKKGMEGDFDTGNMRYKATERYICGVENPRCIFGSLGI